LTGLDKFIAWFLVFQAAAGGLTGGWIAYNGGPAGGTAIILLVAIAAAVAGAGSFRGATWARKLGIAVFALQIPSFQTPWLFYAIWLGVHMNIHVVLGGWGKLGINLLAVVLFIVSVLRYSTPNNSSKPTPLRGAA
jgi:hypothetical protein